MLHVTVRFPSISPIVACLAGVVAWARRHDRIGRANVVLLVCVALVACRRPSPAPRADRTITADTKPSTTTSASSKQPILSLISPPTPTSPQAPIQLAMRDASACARLVDGTVRCWGHVVAHDLIHPASLSLVQLPFANVSTISVFDGQSCAVEVDGTASCWGGADGAGGYAQAWWDERVIVPDYAHADAIALSDGETWILRDHTVTVFENQPLYEMTKSHTPLGTIDDVVEIAGGGAMKCLRKRDGTVWCQAVGRWDPHVAPHPDRIDEIIDARAIAVGATSSCALDGAGKVWCWGYDAGTKVPEVVFPSAMAVASGESSTCVIQTDGLVACIGDWSHKNQVETVPHVVAGIVGAKRLAVGTNAGCATDHDDRVLCWGNVTFNGFSDPPPPELEDAVETPWSSPARFDLPIAPPRTMLPITSDERGKPVEPIAADARCGGNELFDPHVGDCRKYPGGPYGAAGCSMGGGGYSPESTRCLTSSHWAGCTCACDAGKIFDGSKRACVAPPPATP